MPPSPHTACCVRLALKVSKCIFKVNWTQDMTEHWTWSEPSPPQGRREAAATPALSPDGRETLSGFDIYDNEMLWWVLKLLSLVIRPGQWKIQCTGNMFEFFICPGLGIVWAPTFMHVNDDVCVLTMILIPKQKMIFHFSGKNCMHIFNIFPKFGKRNCVLVISKCFLVIDKQWWIYRAGKKHKNIISKC